MSESSTQELMKLSQNRSLFAFSDSESHIYTLQDAKPVSFLLIWAS